MIYRPGGGKVIVGFDLGSGCSQLSYYAPDSKEVETVSSVAGEKFYSIPTVLCKRYGTNQWLYGREAVKAAEDDEGIPVENLLEMALDGEPVQIEGESYEPVALLSLFIKRSLGLLSALGPVERIGALMVTCEHMDHEMIQVLGEALGRIRFKAKHVSFQSYEDSFYQYMLHQPEELFYYQAVLCWYAGDRMKIYRMQANRRTTPVAVSMEQEEYPFLSQGVLPETENLRRERMEKMDRDFLQIMKQVCSSSVVSSVYLIGEGFQEEWLGNTLRYLCTGRRVFLGSNLFCKGACLGMMERLKPSAVGKAHVLLGRDKLKTNVGMRVSRRGEESYCALLDAGISWYEAHTDREFYMQDTDSFELVLTPLTGKRGKIARITLEGMHYPIARMQLRIRMPAQDRMEVSVEELGFGEFREASHQIWTEELPVYGENS